MYPLPPTVDRPDAGYYIENVLTILKELFEAYVSAHTTSILQKTVQVNATAASSSSSLPVRDVVPKVGQSRSRYADHVRSNDIIQPIKTDLDIYLEEDVYLSGMKADFDALAW